MSQTLAVVRSRLAMRLNDMDAPKGTFGVLRYDHAIANAVLMLGARLPAPHLYTPNAVTIAANAETFTLPITVPSGFISAAQYAGDVRLQLASNGMMLVQLSREEMDARRNGIISTTGGSKPTHWAVWEENDQDVQGLCWARSKDAETCHMYVSLVADDLRDSANMDAASVQFSRYGAVAIELHAAISLVSGMVDEDLKARRLNPSAVSLWNRQMEIMLYKEAERRANLEAVGRVYRMVS